MSKVISIRIWSDSLKKISATNFYKYSRSVVYWSDKNILLKWINYFLRRRCIFMEITQKILMF